MLAELQPVVGLEASQGRVYYRGTTLVSVNVVVWVLQVEDTQSGLRLKVLLGM